jgi:hypothetical protein
MAELVDRDQEHLRLLKLGFYCLAGISGFYTLFSLPFIGLGAIVAISGQATKAGQDPRIMGALFVVFGFAFFLMGGAMTWLTYYAARGMEARRHRVLCMILAGLWCLSFPFGTMIGVSAILVLNRPSVKALFEETGIPPEIPSQISRR